MLKIAICDDEREVVEDLEKRIIKFYKAKNIKCLTRGFTTGVDLVLASIKFDVIFLDVDMKPLNGLETAIKLRENDLLASKIIYVTNYSDFSKKALKVHAFAYLLKPINNTEFIEVLSDIIKYEKVTVKEKRFVFKTEEGCLSLSIDDIYYFEKVTRNVRIVHANGEAKTNYQLYYLYDKLKDSNFEPTHKSILVNLLHVKMIKGFDVYLNNGMTVPLAQKKSPIFREKHNMYLQNTYNFV